MPVMSVQELKDHDGDIYKFVRVGGVFRYCLLSVNGLKHSDLVKPGETATAAGSFVVFRPGAWKMSSPYSSTLEVGCRAQDEDDLATELLSIGLAQKHESGLYD